LHQIPELGFELPKTIAYVEHVLAPLNCEVTHPAQSSVCAFFDAGKPDTVAFRADMDALPIQEATGAEYASVHAGRMHACGHDGHMSLLLALAGVADKRLPELPHNVLLIFQPAEETTGGAKAISESGILERYNTACIFGMHLWPELPFGQVWTRPGAVMAQTGIVHVEIDGKSVHVARAKEGFDALYAGVEFLHSVYETAEAIAPTDEKRLLKFGCMQSGTAENALSAHTTVFGTIRTFSAGMRERMLDALHRTADQVSKKTGCRIFVSVTEGYPPVINEKGLYSRVIAHLKEETPQVLDEPYLTGEDFSFYQSRVPGVFFLLGTGGSAPLHAADFDFDEAVLVNGLRLYERLLTI
jgi:hippurate hydrolase